MYIRIYKLVFLDNYKLLCAGISRQLCGQQNFQAGWWPLSASFTLLYHIFAWELRHRYGFSCGVSHAYLCITGTCSPLLPSFLCPAKWAAGAQCECRCQHGKSLMTLYINSTVRIIMKGLILAHTFFSKSWFWQIISDLEEAAAGGVAGTTCWS